MLLLLCSGLGISGCYLTHVASGQLRLLRARQPIEAVLADPATPPDLRHQLDLVQRVREFATDLGLEVDQQYTSYVAWPGDRIVTSLVTTRPGEVEPAGFWFPILGRLPYKGYFDPEKAAAEAARLRAEGLDVCEVPVPAYSTLGWFDDPVLSTFLYLSPPETAALIFHELAHAILYIQDDTAFNEGFATAVAEEGLRRWQSSTKDLKGYENWLLKGQRRQQFISLVSKYRAKLQDLYQDKLPLTEKRNQKAAVFNQMRSEFLDLKSDHSAMAAYDAWFRNPLNNAQLISVSTYHNWVPAFRKMLSASGGDLEEFYQNCRQLAKKDATERQRILEHLINSNREIEG